MVLLELNEVLYIGAKITSITTITAYSYGLSNNCVVSPKISQLLYSGMCHELWPRHLGTALQHTLKVSTLAGPPCITGIIAPKVKAKLQLQLTLHSLSFSAPVFYFCNHSCCPLWVCLSHPWPHNIPYSLILGLFACLFACLLPSFLVYAFPRYIGQLSEFWFMNKYKWFLSQLHWAKLSLCPHASGLYCFLPPNQDDVYIPGGQCSCQWHALLSMLWTTAVSPHSGHFS